VAEVRKLFKDRDDALRRVLEIIPQKEMLREPWTVLAISVNGVYFASKIAKSINADLELLFTEPISAPNSEDCAIAVVSETEEIVIHNELIEAFGINLDYIYGEAKRNYEEKIIKYIYKYRKGDKILNLKNRNVLLVDEGIETGLTAMCAIKSVINMGAKTVSIAVPTMPLDVVEVFNNVLDDIYCPVKIENFVETRFYYEVFVESVFSDIQNLLSGFVKDKDKLVKERNVS